MKKYLKLSVSFLAILTLSIDAFGTSSDGVSHNIGSTGKYVIKANDDPNQKVLITRAMKIAKGIDSTEKDKDTGAIHNHHEIAVLKDGSITGDGKIVNYGDITKDFERAELGSTDDSYNIAQKYKDTESSKLTKEEDLADAAYYDFAHRSSDAKKQNENLDVADIDRFYIAQRAVVRKSDETDPARYDKEKSTIISSKPKTDDMVAVELRNDFEQSKAKENGAFYLGNLAKSGGLTSTHSSEIKEEIKGSFHSLTGYESIDAENMLEQNGYTKSVANTFKKHTYTATIKGNIIKTDDPNLVATLPTGQKGTAFSFERKETDGTYSYIPVFVPEVDERLVLTKTMPEGKARTEYESKLSSELAESRKNGSFRFSEWDENDPITIYSGASSWYNGVFKLEHGAAIIPNTAELFGGRMEIGKVPEGFKNAKLFHEAIENGDVTAIDAAKQTAPTEFEFQGGPKDEYNRPDIYMNGNSSLYFNTTADNDGNKIFSFYGNLHGTEQDRVIVQDGEIRWKGDGSGYKGSLAIAEGSKFEVRSSDKGSSTVYEGKFPNANIYQIYATEENGHKAGDLVTTTEKQSKIDTVGIENITIQNGNVLLINEGEESGGKITLTNSTLERSSFVEIAGESEVEDVTVKGVAVANGNMKTKNLTLQGGVLAVQGSIETENAELGSTIALWGNSRIDRSLTIGNSTSAGELTIRDNHTLKLFIDAEPATGRTDGIKVQSGTVINAGNGVRIGGINFINSNLSSISDSKTFQVISGGTATNIPVEIGAIYTGETNATFVAYQDVTDFATLPTPVTGGTADPDSDVRYNYSAPTTGTQLTTRALNDSTGGWIIEYVGTKYYIYGSDIAGYGNYVIQKTLVSNAISADNFVIPVQSMHLTALSDVSQTFSLVSDDYGYADKYQTGKFGFWNKTFGGKDKFETDTSNDIKSTNYGTIFGFDAKPVVIGSGTTEFMGTIFGGIFHKHMKFVYQTQDHKVNQNSYIAGLKGSFFNSKSSLELMGSYHLVKSDSKKSQYSANIKSHLYSFGAKAAYNFDLTNKLSLRPSLLIDYTFAKTPSYSVISTGTTNIKNMHRFDLVPELSLNGKFGQWKTNIFANYHQRFGSKGTYTFRGTEHKDMTKKNYIEFGAGINRVSLDNKTNVALKLSKKTSGIKGIKASLNIGFKF